MLKNQKFGVEIEMTGLTRAAAAKVIAKYFHTRNSAGDRTCYETREITDTQGRIWKVMRDGSVAGGGQQSVEMVTPPLNYNDIESLQEIIRKLKEAGARTDSSCGIHIHIDGANHNPQSLRRLVNFFTSRQDLIYESLEIGHRANEWCKKLSPELLEEMKKTTDIRRNRMEAIWYSTANDNYSGGISRAHYNSTRYHGINLHSFFSKGTVEFRLFNGTLHAGKVKAYIQFCLSMSAWAIESNERISFRSTSTYTAAQKVTIMRNILLNRLNLKGDEFRTCRLHLMTPLKKAAGMVTRSVA
ncbi:MAG: amidoligase family protein [Lachnospiraceae bacterium]